MASNGPDEVYDLLFLVDATSSMADYLNSLTLSLPKVISISRLTNSFERIGLLAYRDYTEADHIQDGRFEWSGWYDSNHSVNNGDQANVSAKELMDVAARLRPTGGGDYPEATKSGLAKAYSLMREEATTIVLFYTDAPPHCWMVTDREPGSNYHREQEALNEKEAYGESSWSFADWVSACKLLHIGPRRAHVLSFLDEGLGDNALMAGYYTYLSTITRGACFTLTDRKPHSIAQVTVEVLLAWMGAEEKNVAEKITLPAKLVRYKRGETIRKIKNEKDAIANAYFWASSADPSIRRTQVNVYDKELKNLESQLEENRTEAALDSEVLKKYMPKKKTSVGDFAQWYARDDQYKKIVVEQLKSIIEADVTSMSLNSVFGVLWRAVCNDRENPARGELISDFGLHVDKIRDVDEKTRMKNWLEESYNYAADILDMLQEVPESQRFPCVFLDPTIDFKQARKRGEKIDEDEDEDEDDREVTAFRRDELLEIGRSCDGRILRRLGKVLTRITYVQSAADLPEHIAVMSDAEVPKIPVSLASKEQGWKFWKILLHVVLPGTMLSARPAVVLAALAIRIGLKDLFEPACAAMLFWRDKWNNLEVPETWNSSCLGLLLDADAEYREHIRNEGVDSIEDHSLLLESDRELFSRLVSYKLAEANLLTTLTAEVGWTSDRTQMSIGPVVMCRGCKYPRSITIMAERTGGRCGICVIGGWQDAKHKARAMNAHISREDNERSKATWIECSVRTCRAQYVCYNPEDLNVRPKCHYCRMQSASLDKRDIDPAPTLECNKCLSKVIWPREWREIAPALFHCVACAEELKTIVSVDTNAEQICKENGQAWLLQNNNDVLKDPFNKRTLFHTISTVGTAAFAAHVRILPPLDPEPALTLHGKLIRNQAAIKANLESWIQRRSVEKSSCSLCFSDFPNARLFPACRRQGCHQSICEGCLNSWYGLNKAGTIINTAALYCPFCRRRPAPRTLAAYGLGIHSVGGLENAIEEKGSWIYAWCYDCNHARRHMPRECTRGAPYALPYWQCEECAHLALERTRLEEEQARQALEEAQRLDAEAFREARLRLERAEQLRNELEIPIKECPGCKVPTQKIWGCDHMTCPAVKCHTHWCWACGKKFDARNIYEHLLKVHGAI
jgi:hypothetical protein